MTAAIDAINTQKPARVAVQIPEGLKTRGLSICAEIEKRTGTSTILLIEPSFGACMLFEDKARALGAQLLIHLGHSQFYKETLPTVYIPVYYAFDSAKLDELSRQVQQLILTYAITRIGLIGTVQMQRALPQIQQRLQTNGVHAEISANSGFLSQGQVLGCNYSGATAIASRVDAFVYIGEGRFHPLGLVIATNKPVFTLNPHSFETSRVSDERDAFYKKRVSLIAHAQQARVFGILVNTFKGQMSVAAAENAKRAIEAAGKRAILLGGELLKPEYVSGIAVDALVNTACPRIASDDSNNYGVPVISLYELDFALGKKRLEEFELSKTV